MYNHIELLQNAVLAAISEYGSMAAAARTLGVSSAHFSNVMKGKDSPTLRRVFGIRKHPRRVRLCIEATPDLIAKFDRACRTAGIGRQELLSKLLEDHNEKDAISDYYDIGRRGAFPDHASGGE